MAGRRDGESGSRKTSHRESEQDEILENGLDELEPDFSDPEDFVDDVDDDGLLDFKLILSCVNICFGLVWSS